MTLGRFFVEAAGPMVVAFSIMYAASTCLLAIAVVWSVYRLKTDPRQKATWAALLGLGLAALFGLTGLDASAPRLARSRAATVRRRRRRARRARRCRGP